LGQIRNVIMHRGGIADRRIVAACPWLGLAAGDEVIITRGRCELYGWAANSYVAELISRVNERFGLDIAKARAERAERFARIDAADSTLGPLTRKAQVRSPSPRSPSASSGAASTAAVPQAESPAPADLPVRNAGINLSNGDQGTK
jgi:hypothetical protein